MTLQKHMGNKKVFFFLFQDRLIFTHTAIFSGWTICVFKVLFTMILEYSPNVDLFLLTSQQ